MRKKIVFYFSVLITVFGVCGIATDIYFGCRYHKPRIETGHADDGTLQQQLDAIKAELKRTRAALKQADQSVERLEELDKRRGEGIKRIGGIIDEAGKSVVGIASGERRARIAFEAIAGIVDILENEFGGSPD